MGFIDPSEIDAEQPTDIGTIGLSGGSYIDPSELDVPASDLGAIRNAGVRGVSGLMGLADELLPGFSPQSTLPGKVVPPHLFGLFGTPRPAASLAGDTSSLATSAGLLDQTKPATEFGKLASEMTEAGTSAGPFGPLAMLASAVFGGTGAYGGEKVGAAFGAPEIGRGVGSFLGGVTPSAVNKIGIVKEAAEQLGPTVSQIPGLRKILGNSAVESAVGRAIGKQASNLPAVETALTEANRFVGPPSAIDTFKDIADITGDTGLARTVDAAENLVPNAGFKDMAANRAAARAEEVFGANPRFEEGLAPYTVSKEMEAVQRASIQAVEAAEDAAWLALPKEAPLPIGSKIPEIRASIDDITQGVVPEGAAIQGLLTRLNSLEDGAITVGQVQKLRSRALEIARNGRKSSNLADKDAGAIAGQIAQRLNEAVDESVELGVLADDVGEIWRNARSLTQNKIQTFSAPAKGNQNTGTRALEALLNEGNLDNTTLLREGLTSPDKMTAHLNAARLGGQDVAPLYRQALMSELEGVPQARWAGIINDKAEQWGQVFDDSEIARINRGLVDFEAEALKNRRAFTTNSQTNTRGNIQKRIESQKGLAQWSDKVQSGAALAGGLTGASAGWDSADTTLGGLARGVLGGLAGAAGGKALGGASVRASEAFDTLLVEALKNPATASRVIEAAKPSDLAKALKQAGVSAAITGTTKGAATILGDLTKKVLTSSGTSQPDTDLTPKDKDMTKSKKDIELEIDSDPFFSLAYELESGRGKYLKNPKSSASGPFQMINSTAKAVGVNAKDDDFSDDLEGMKKLKAEYLKQGIEDDPISLYAAHYLGVPTLKKWLAGETLTDRQQQHVDDFQDILIPRAQKFLKKFNGQVKA